MWNPQYNSIQRITRKNTPYKVLFALFIISNNDYLLDTQGRRGDRRFQLEEKRDGAFPCGVGVSASYRAARFNATTASGGGCRRHRRVRRHIGVWLINGGYEHHWELNDRSNEEKVRRARDLVCAAVHVNPTAIALPRGAWAGSSTVGATKRTC
jgi:hypothetical protein